jgi:hypothetical protein
MNNEFKKMQKLAGLITESEYKEEMSENMMGKRLDQDDYMDMLNRLFDALGNGANAYDETTWTEEENTLVGGIANILNRAGVDIS